LPKFKGTIPHPPAKHQQVNSKDLDVAMKRKVAALEKIDADLYVNCDTAPRLLAIN
jgi:hypothetical protein